MKKINNISISIFLATIVFFAGCADRSDITDPSTQAVATGSANFTRMVSIGNSITSGYQSSSLYEDGQQYSFPKQIADQVHTSYVQPLISNPGIGGRIDIQSLNTSTGSVVLYTNPADKGTPLNSSYAAPFNNIGIPGAVLGDVIYTTDFAAQAAAPRNNPFFQVVLRSSALGSTMFNQAKNLQPTFLTLWIGNNDVLGFATSGGTKPSAPTSAAQFDALYKGLVDSITNTLPNTKVAVGNIPSVTSIPFFTTVGPAVAKSIGNHTMYYQRHTDLGPGLGTVDSLNLAKYNVLFTLIASNYAPLLGQQTAKYWRDNNLAVPAGCDTTQPFGFHPLNPFPNSLVLDPDEMVTAQNAVQNFNNSISSSVSAKANFVLVDANKVLSDIRANDATAQGTVFDGISFRSSFITGGLFSLDGVHPTNQGHAILANAFISAINAKFGAAIPKINVASLPTSLYFHKALPLSKIGLPVFPAGSFDNLLF